MIEYINPDTKKVIKLDIPVNKKLIILYGKNGVGKTTFSRLNDFEKGYVFNLDFIHKNVYIVGEDGAKTSSTNKDSFSELFIGEEVVSKRKYLKELLENKKACDDLYQNNVNDIIKTLGKEFEGLIDKECKLLKDTKFSYSPNIKIEKIIEEYKYPGIDCNITNETEFNNEYSKYKEKSLVGMLIGDLNKSEFLKAIILDSKVDEINVVENRMKSINKKLIYKNELNEILISREINIYDIDQQWIKKGLEIHSERNKCILCGSKDVKSKIDEWNKVLCNIFVSEKNKLKAYLEKQIKYCEDILEKKEHYIRITPLLIKKLENLIEYLRIQYKYLLKDEYTNKVSFDNIEIEKLTTNTEKIMNNLVLYKLNIKSSLIYSSFTLANCIKEEVSIVKRDIEDHLEKNSLKLVEDLNRIFDIMKFDKKFNISIDRRAGIKYKFTINGKQINILSDGQRHKLALALFIKSIKEKGLKDKTIVLDDPVVALDEETYHGIKDLVIGIRKEEDSTRIIILTHNIYYTYIQLSNIFENETIRQLTSFYRMTKNEIKELNIDILRTDDIALFKQCIINIQTEDELLILGGITCKIFRFILDIKLRFQGITSTMNPSLEIDLLKISEQNKTQLKKISSYLKKNCMLSRLPNTDTIIACFIKLKEASDMLGINNYILDSDIKKFMKLSTNKKYSFDMSSDNLYFDFVNSANKILYTDDFESIKNYLAHPRQQITKQITSISNDLK